MNPWVRFFFGTPQRLIGTCFAILVLASVVNPAIGATLISTIISAATPFIGMAITIGIVILVFRGMIGGRRK